MKRIVFLSCLGLISCVRQNPYEGLYLPDEKEYGIIIKEIYNNDIIFNLKSNSEKISVSKTLVIPKIEMPYKKSEHAEELDPFSIHPNAFNLFGKIEQRNRPTDSLYLAFQCSQRSNSTLNGDQTGFKVTSEANDNYLQFSIPLLSSNNIKAFVLCAGFKHNHFNAGIIYQLSKNNGNWTVENAVPYTFQ